eukprot:scaffold26_cov159-Ochromonas_danica.AAC.17
MLCYAMLCYAMLCYAMLCYAMHATTGLNAIYSRPNNKNLEGDLSDSIHPQRRVVALLQNTKIPISCFKLVMNGLGLNAKLLVLYC